MKHSLKDFIHLQMIVVFLFFSLSSMTFATTTSDRQAYDFVVSTCSPLSDSTMNELSGFVRHYSEVVLSMESMISDMDEQGFSDLVTSNGLGLQTRNLLLSDGYYQGLHHCWPKDESARNNFTKKLLLADAFGKVVGADLGAMKFLIMIWTSSKIFSYVYQKIVPFISSAKSIFSKQALEERFMQFLFVAPIASTLTQSAIEYKNQLRQEDEVRHKENQKLCQKIARLQNLRNRILSDPKLQTNERNQLILQIQKRLDHLPQALQVCS